MFGFAVGANKVNFSLPTSKVVSVIQTVASRTTYVTHYQLMEHEPKLEVCVKILKSMYIKLFLIEDKIHVHVKSSV